ncbi:exported hypothetical protein [uncultured delta proteobacterium]|uniref:Uncharacterized protein n=1 Tax=uncultured delta proteobacterium TaxID=34034 RepID=A0A212IYL8_9DELT|nr:exported hypothetical protein [uncultured delta proteobacterium]
MKIMKATMSAAARGTNASTFRMVRRDAGSGDSANFSAEALNLSTANKNAKFTASTMSVEVEGHTFTFNNSTGAMTWDGKKLDFSNFDRIQTFANPLAYDLTFQLNSAANELAVYSSGAMSHAFNATTGAQVKSGMGWEIATGVLDRTKAMIVLNNRNQGTWVGGSLSGPNGGTGNDVIINRKEGTSITGGGGNDQIFNFAKTVGTLDGGTGSDAIYSVGLSAGAITAGSDGSDAYVGLVGVMNGGSVTVGKGKNIIEAAGATLNNISITDGGAGTKSTALMAKIVNGGVLNLGADATGLDVGTLNSNVTLGAGANSLVADKVTGVTVTSSGNDSFQFKDLAGTNINASGSSVVNVTNTAKNAKIKLGSGANTVNAAGKTLTSVDISDTAGASTAILAGSVIGTAAARSKIALNGNGTDGNGLVVSGAITYADINTGSGKGELSAASVTNSILNMGVGGTSAQTVTVKGAMTGSTLKTGNGNDTISILTTKNSTVNLGDGDNTYTGKTAGNLTYSGGAGRDDVHFSGSVVNSSMDLGQGTNSFKAATKDKNGNDVGQAVTNTAIKSYGSTTILAGKYTAGLTGNMIDLGVGSHSVTLASIVSSTGVRATVKMDVGGTQASDV